MSAPPAEPNLGVPTFVYTMQQGFLPKKDYSVDDIKSALQTLTSGNIESLSESTFETVLDIIHYPEHLDLLVNPRLTPALFGILMRYPNGRSAINFSFGYLLFQCLALGTAVGLLAQNGKLDPFIKSIGPSTRQDRTDVSPLMTTWLMEMINEDMSPAADILINIQTRLGWAITNTDPLCLLSIGGHSLTSTLYLTAHCFMGRDGALKAYTSKPSLGWPALLLVMWAQIKPSDLDEKVLFMTKLREAVLRYCLVSAPSEHFVLQALVDDFANVVPPHEKHPPPLNTFNAMGFDAMNVEEAIVQQLSFRQIESTSAKLKYLTRITDYATEVINNPGAPRSFALIEAAFNRVWHEIACAPESPDRDFPEHVMLLAALPLRAIMKQFVETASMEQLPFGIGSRVSLVPQILDALTKIDLVSLLGRLLLLPTVATSSRTSPAPISAGTLSDNSRIISQLTQSLSKYRLRARPAFSKGYRDWLKTLNCMTQLQYTSMRQNQPLFPIIKDCISAWNQLGQALGYFEQTQRTLCHYPRCPGGMEGSSGFVACDVCSEAVYCSVTCQQADWEYDPAPHSDKCGEDE
ncbi:hypothetical protein BDV93DRAFT_549087 [Ceratobasidium sp. AG-I]|nr:hypothetical protein BDV93DRAFT_549087 [Ceratobasidium sp. AG-I]